jgi:uncharacterized protein
MKIALDRLTAPRTTHTIGPGYQLAVAGFEVAGGVSATLEVHLAEHGVVVVNGAMLAKVVQHCDRCLGEFDITVNESFTYHYTVGYAPELERAFKDSNDRGGAAYDIDELAEPILDVDDILREQIYLCIPHKLICGEGCRGLCAGCGANLNNQKCSCSSKRIESVFGVLQNIKGT